MAYYAVATVDELAPGDVKAVRVGAVEMVLYRSGDAYFAAQRQCLHQGGDLADGIISRGFLVCPLHGWKFHADSGRHALSPQTCLKTYAVRVEGDVIQVDPQPRWQGQPPGGMP